jgi:predicted HTH transcriptional regulator
LCVGDAPHIVYGDTRQNADDASRKIGDIARTQCYPAIHVIINITEHEGKRIAVVEVPASVARPHFRGECFARECSTNRRATDAEILALRMSGADPKLSQLLMRKAAGKTEVVTCDMLPRSLMSKGEGRVTDITENYVSVKRRGRTRTIPLSEIPL